MAFRYLWTPLQLGPVVTRNRIVFSAHLTNYARDGKPTEQHAAYYAARAAGGTGLIITEEHSTHPTDWPYEKLIHGFHRDVIPGYRAHHRRGAPPSHADLRPDQPQRRPGVVDVLAPAGVGAVAGRRPAVPRGAEGGDSRRDRRDRRRLRTGRRALRRGRLRRHRAAVLALARSSAASSPPPPTAAPTSTAARSRTGRASSSTSSPPCAR